VARVNPNDAERGRSALRFSIPEAFKDGGGLIIECRAFEMGPRGGAGEELKLSKQYWMGLLKRLAETDG
jgi:hypothetical protein